MEFIIVGLVLAFGAFGLYHVLGDFVRETMRGFRKGYAEGKAKREAQERDEDA
jgi:hypothetical protein